MKSRYYPHIDKAKVFGDHYVRDFSEHSRGVAVDVSLLYAKTGKPVDMGGHHDLLDPSSTTDSTLVTPSQRRNRMILKTAFEKQGFANYAPEWWHYRLLNEPEPTLHYYFPVWDGMTSAGRPIKILNNDKKSPCSDWGQGDWWCFKCYFITMCCVSSAIISSSSVGVTTTRTFEAGVDSSTSLP